MNTAEKLEAMTDRGKFEILATSILRKSKADYEAVLHSGLNAKGETVKSPIDGFCQIPDSHPPHFILMQHATTDRNGLKKKWLYDHSATKRTKRATKSEDGDLVKAAREATELREDFAGAKFTVVLTTNQRPPESLVKDVYKKAHELHVECDIWDQSRLADFLDTTPEGQWLRKEYLGIDAELLSESLLASLCKKSLELYEREFLTNPNYAVPREITKLLERDLQNGSFALHFLVGESGFGKSTIVHRVLQNRLASANYGVWLRADLIEDHLSLESALDKVLRELYPRLLPEAGQVALRLVRQTSPLLIVIDDVNRTSFPSRLIRKLLTWSKPQDTTSNSQILQSSLLIVCPVWPHIWGAVSREYDKTPWVNVVSVESMTVMEASAAVQANASSARIEITQLEAEGLAKNLGNDPILIGLFGSLILSGKQQMLGSLTENVIRQFIDRNITGVSSDGEAHYLPADYRLALSNLTSHLLRDRNPNPIWEEIQEWLKDAPEQIQALRILIHDGKLCRLSQIAGQEKLVFRHDRIQEWLLVDSLVRTLSTSTTNESILTEPFYAGIIAKAILLSPQTRDFLAFLREKLPLALAEAVRQFGVPASDYHYSIVNELKDWANADVTPDTIPESVLGSICWSMVYTDSPVVLEITETLPRYPLVLLARLRNGDAKSGAQYCNGEAIYMTDVLRDQIIEQALRHHREQIAQGLKRILTSSSTDGEREGALTLAGLTGLTDLENEIAICWEQVVDKPHLLPEAIWAGIQCCGPTLSKILDPLLSYWAELPDEKDGDNRHSKGQVAESLRFAFARGMNVNVMGYLVAQCNVHESLRSPLAYACAHFDSPEAIEFVIRTASDIERSHEGTNKFSPWVMSMTDIWDVTRSGGRKLSQKSLDRLMNLWREPSDNKYLRTRAFQMWLTGMTTEQLDVLRAISPDSPLYRQALQKRMQLGDLSAVPDLVAIVSDATDREWIYWLREAYHVWCNEIMEVVDNHLRSFQHNIPTDFSGGMKDIHYSLSELLMRIPTQQAETLLIKYWECLAYSPLFVQAALYIGTPTCLELAASSINKCPTNVPILEHLSIHFGIMTTGKHELLTIQHFENLTPYLDRLNESDLWQLAEACQRLGFPEWSLRHLANRLNEDHRKCYHPTDEELIQDLDEFVADEHGVWRVQFWVEDFDKRHDSKDRVLRVTEGWLRNNTTIKGLEIAAACIQAIGARKNLPLLDEYTIEGPPQRIANIKESAKFYVCRRSLN